MKWASASAAGESAADLVAEVAATVGAELGPLSADLVALFLSPHFARQYHDLWPLIEQHLPGAVVVGCSADGIIGGGAEIEGERAVSVTAAHLPGVDLWPLHTDAADLPDADAPPAAWREYFGLPDSERRDFIVLADPFTPGVQDFIAGLDYALPDPVIVGGLASGGGFPGDSALYLNHETYSRGVVGVGLSGDVAVDTVVAQGCRPIGQPLQITGCADNMLTSVADQSPLEYLERLHGELGDGDRKLMQTALYVGIAIDPFAVEAKPGEFLIRSLLGMDTESGSLVVGESLEVGQMIQFHLRDRAASEKDLLLMLKRYQRRGEPTPPAGGLLFSCLGRGVLLYGRENHDSDLFAAEVGDIPLGGFFCNGEIGPVGDSTYIHSYTSAFALFRAR